MKIFIQWSTNTPQDWVEYDSSSIGVTPKPIPDDNSVLDATYGWINAINVQGVVIGGWDHYNIQETTKGLEITTWSDDSDDAIHTPDRINYHRARKSIFRNLAQDTTYGGAWNTDQEFHELIYSEFYEPQDGITFNGIWISDESFDLARDMRTSHGWREWIDGVDASQIYNGKVIDQRDAGNWLPPNGTMTWYQSCDPVSITAVNAQEEYKLYSTPPGNSEEISEKIGKSSTEVPFAWSNQNDPPNALWTTGTYRCVIDVQKSNDEIDYGISSLDDSNGGFKRVSNSHVVQETHDQDQPLFTGTGLKLATYTGSWTSSSTSDYLVVCLVATNNKSKDEDFKMDVGLSDHYVDGPWVLFSIYDEEMNGGIITNGASVYDKTYHKQMEGVALVDGSSIYNKTSIEQMEAGVNCNSSADIDYFTIYFEFMEGGISLNSSSVDNHIISEQMYDGVICGGISDETFNDQVYMYGGSLVDGSSVDIHIIAEQMLGGVFINGSADEDFNDQITMDGGAVCSGNSIYSVITSRETNGGVSCSGDTFYGLTLQEQMNSGVVCNGYSIVTDLTLYYETMEGGSVVNGYSVDNHIISEQMYEGALCNSSSYYNVISYKQMQGGSLCNNASIDNHIIAERMVGGIVCNGYSIETFNDQVSTYGGISVNGSSIDNHIIAEQMSGGIVCSGIADDNFNCQEIMQGGALCNSASVDNHIIAERMVGGIVCNGYSIVKDLTLYYETMEGGSVVNGYSIDNIIVDEQLYGGVLCNSSSVDNIIIAEQMENGVSCDGISIFNIITSEQMNGGIVCNGDSFYDLIFSNVMDGGTLTNGYVLLSTCVTMDSGATISGSAVDECVFSCKTFCGALCNSSAICESVFIIETFGGTVINGLSLLLTYEEMHGGAILNGSAEEDFNDQEIMDGGISCGGFFVYEKICNIQSSGGILSNAISNYNVFKSHIMEEGVVCSGTATVTDLTLYYEVMDGGTVCNFTSFYNQIISPVSYGGAKLNGASDFLTIMYPLLIASIEEGPQGPTITLIDRPPHGVLCNGNVLPSRLYQEEMNNGTLCHGYSIVTELTIHDEEMDGGVFVNTNNVHGAIYSPSTSGGIISLLYECFLCNNMFPLFSISISAGPNIEAIQPQCAGVLCSGNILPCINTIDIMDGGIHCSGLLSMLKISDIEILPYGVLAGGCPCISHLKTYITEYAVGDCVFIKMKAMNGILKKIVLKKQKAISNGRFKNLYTDTLNAIWNETEIIYKNEAIALANLYYENQKKLVERQKCAYDEPTTLYSNTFSYADVEDIIAADLANNYAKN